MHRIVDGMTRTRNARKPSEVLGGYAIHDYRSMKSHQPCSVGARRCRRVTEEGEENCVSEEVEVLQTIVKQ